MAVPCSCPDYSKLHQSCIREIAPLKNERNISSIERFMNGYHDLIQRELERISKLFSAYSQEVIRLQEVAHRYKQLLETGEPSEALLASVQSLSMKVVSLCWTPDGQGIFDGIALLEKRAEEVARLDLLEDRIGSFKDSQTSQYSFFLVGEESGLGTRVVLDKKSESYASDLKLLEEFFYVNLRVTQAHLRFYKKWEETINQLNQSLAEVTCACFNVDQERKNFLGDVDMNYFDEEEA